MAYKIAYLYPSKHDVNLSPLKSFCECAKSLGADFWVEKIDIASLTSEKVAELKTFDAIVAGGFPEISQQFLNEVANVIGLYAKCAFKSFDFGNLTAPNLVIVSDIRGNENSGFGTNKEFGREAFDLLRYSELEIERTARIAYELAETRMHHLTLSDTDVSKRTSGLWRKIVSDINEDYPSIHLDFESLFETTRKLICEPDDYDVILTPEHYFDALSGVADARNHLGNGTSQIAYLGETTVGLYSTEKPAVYAPLFDMLAIDKMLAHSFDLPSLKYAWDEEINKVACKRD